MKRFAVPALCLLAFACNASGSLVQTPPHGRDVFHVAELEPPLGPSEEESCAADPVEDTALAKIVIIGGRQAEGFVMGLAADGTLDLDFGINGRIFFGYRSAYHGVRLPDCRLVVTTGNQIEIFSRNGLPANGFGSTDGTGTIFLPGPGLLGHGLANAPNGDLLTSWDGMSVFRISPEGSAVTYPALDPGPSSNGVARNAYTAVIAIAPDGTIVLGGSVSSDDGCMGIGRRLPNGTSDESFSPGGTRGFGEGTTSHDLEISRDGRYFLAGTDELYNGVLLRVWN